MMTARKLTMTLMVATMIFIGSGAPAAATDHAVVTTAGTLNTVLGNFALDRGETGPCAEKPSTRVFTTDVGGTWSLGGTVSMQFQLPSGSGNWYQIERTILPGSGGTWTGAGPTHPVNGTLGVQQRVYILTVNGSPIDCTKSNLGCVITGVFTLQQGTYSGASPLPTTTPGDQLTFNGTTAVPLVVSQCRPPWNSVGGTSATLSGVVLTLA